MKPAVIGGAVLVLVLVLVGVFMMSGGSGDSPAEDEKKAESKTGNENEKPPEEPNPVEEVKEPAAKMIKQQETLEQAQEQQGDKEEKQAAAKQEEKPAEVPKNEPSKKPDSITGLVGWFEPKNFDWKAGRWEDSSSKKNHATEIKGRPEKVTEDGVTFIMGGNDSGIRFPTKVMTTGRKFTMFSVAKYNGQRQGRIVEGYGGGANFLSGFHWWRGNTSGSMGGSHRGGSGWISHPHHDRMEHMNDEQKSKWYLNVEQKHLHRMNGFQRSGLTNGRALVPRQMSINHGDLTPHAANAGWAKQQSDWAAGDFIFYNRELSLSEIKMVETYLMKKYNIAKESRPMWSNRNLYAREKGWLDPYPDCKGAACADQFKSLGTNRMGSDCGPEGVMSRSLFHRHHRTHERGSNGNYWFENHCIQGVEGELVEKKSNYIDITDSRNWWEKGKRELWEMDCRGQAINSFNYESSGDKSRLRLKYTCNQAPVAEDSCREIEAMRHGKDIHKQHPNTWNNDRDREGGPFSSMETQDLNCGVGQVLTKVQYSDDENGSVRMKGTCCNLADV